MAGIFRNLKSPSLAIDGTADHLRILFSLSRTIALADLVEQLRTGSLKWIKTKGREFRNFHWQKGYGGFSIGQSGVRLLKQYIASQKEHHRKVSFQNEFRQFLRSYEIEYGERYVWDGCRAFSATTNYWFVDLGLAPQAVTPRAFGAAQADPFFVRSWSTCYTAPSFHNSTQQKDSYCSAKNLRQPKKEPFTLSNHEHPC